MPLVLDTPEVVSQTIDTLEINSFSVDIERGEIHIGYDKGSVIDNNFVPDIPNLIHTVEGVRFMAAIRAADTYANAMVAGQVSVYGALKLALYDELKLVSGLSGTVT